MNIFKKLVPQQQAELPNWALVAAIARNNQNPSLKNRQAICDLLPKAVLVIGVRELPPELADHPPGALVEISEDVMIKMLTTTSPNGESALSVFTDAKQLERRCASANPLFVHANAVFSLMARSGYTGCVINAGGPWVYLSSRDVMRAFS